MTVFLILAAALVAGALLLVLPPMLGAGRIHAHAQQAQRQAETVLVVSREQLVEIENAFAAGDIDEAEYHRARSELEQRALAEGEAVQAHTDLRPSRVWALLSALAVPVLAIGIYLTLGEPNGLDPVQSAAPEGGHEITPAQIAQMVSQLATRLEREPNNPEGWIMLARSYAMMQDFQTATATYQKIGHNMPEHPDVFAEWGDLIAGAQGRKVSGEAERLVKGALALDPNHMKALALAGAAAFQQQDFVKASAYWEQVLAQVPPSEDFARSIRASINEARTKGGMPALDHEALPQAGADKEAGVGAPLTGLTVKGRVTLAPEIASRAAADDAVFVFVRPAQGGKPLAALRYRVADLPAEFSFEKAERMSDGPVPDRVSIGARVSKLSEAAPRSGDLEGRTVAVAPNATAVAVVIDRIRE